MAKKEFTYRGKTFEELSRMSIDEFSKLVTARARRTLKRGLSDSEKVLLKKLRAGDKNAKTHCRKMVIIPEMVDKTVGVYNGKQFVQVMIQKEMIGRFLGEFSLTRSKVNHSAPGIGATKSSASLSVR